MIRNLLFLALPLVLLASCSSSPNSLQQENLRGPVKSVRTQSFSTESKFGEVSKGKLSYGENSLKIFDQAGYVQEESEYFTSGRLMYKQVYTYDADHRMTHLSVYRDEGELEAKIVAERGEDNLTKENVYDDKGSLESVRISEREGDHVVRTVSYDADGRQTGEFRLKWKGHKLLEHEICDSIGQVTDGWYFTYQNGQVSELLVKNDRGDTRFEYVRNEYGDPVQQKRIDKEEEILTTYAYKYDDRGNWIEQIEFLGEGKRAEGIIERVIEYY